MATVVTDGYQYIRNGDESEELYHLRSDPDALRDLADSPEHASTLYRLRSIMEELRPRRTRAHSEPPLP